MTSFWSYLYAAPCAFVARVNLQMQRSEPRLRKHANTPPGIHPPGRVEAAFAADDGRDNVPVLQAEHAVRLDDFVGEMRVFEGQQLEELHAVRMSHHYLLATRVVGQRVDGEARIHVLGHLAGRAPHDDVPIGCRRKQHLVVLAA